MSENKVFTVCVVLADGSNRTVGRYKSAETVLEILQAFGNANVQAFVHGRGGEVLAWNYLDGDTLALVPITALDGLVNFSVAYELNTVVHGRSIAHRVLDVTV